MSETETIEVPEFLRLYEFEREQHGWIDVRSEGEHEKAALPGFVNLPILNNVERHLVGLTYKRKGQPEAIRLGHELVDPHRPQRVDAWNQILNSSPSGRGVMICWRGGMRSGIAASWAREAGARVTTVVGGFKAIRNELLKEFSTLPEVLILSGLTGSGKTELLKEVIYPKIDLEKLANHRGSSFGRKIRGKQPSQATFENHLALELRRFRHLAPPVVPLLLEDESATIGSCFLPTELKARMNGAPCIWVESSYEERAARIFAEYILEPLDEGIPPREIADWMIASLLRIERKLGGLETKITRELIESAFAKGEGHGMVVEDHLEWITRLLKVYYDPMYQYGFNQHVERGRRTSFRGTIEECRQWLETRSDSRKR